MTNLNRATVDWLLWARDLVREEPVDDRVTLEVPYGKLSFGSRDADAIIEITDFLIEDQFLVSAVFKT